jgi:hypothetical protein
MKRILVFTALLGMFVNSVEEKLLPCRSLLVSIMGKHNNSNK